MSKIGKQPIKIPKDVKIEIKGNEVFIDGKKGKLKKILPPEVSISQKDEEIYIGFNGSKEKKALWGTWQAHIKNAVNGVDSGFEKELKVEGVGWRAELQGKELILKVGFTNPIKVSSPENIDFKVEKNIIKISGIDKEKVGLIAAKIRAFRPPEPYKGKGIRYKDEVVVIKAGKKAVGAE